MCGTGRIGVDVAYPVDFAGHYPFGRAFSPEELDWARALCPDDTARSAALIWSAKEAALKAIGTGFNFFDPLEVRVGPPLFGKRGIFLNVLAERRIAVWAKAEGSGWISLALT
jgi:phosphopantetheinyl transferase